ncbi:DUF418 domain-containing protein [Bacillus sp. FSL K6-0268]|uniref:DUF418 domain-containing protein n=1 Tax=Bacillus sp. FSL K6-0268 TaxID=2921449 RepID=UPI0030FA070F
MHHTKPTSSRILSLDIIRGFALLGILIAHASGGTQGQKYPIYSLDFDLSVFNNLFIHFKFVSIYSFLFGIGSYIFVSHAQQRGLRSYYLFSRRLITLLSIGIIPILIFPQITPILIIYGLLGFILLPFFKLQPRIILIIAGILASCNMIFIIGTMVFRNPLIKDFSAVFMIIQYFIYYILVIVTMFLLGLYVGKICLFQQLSHKKNIIKRIHRISFFLSLLLVLVGLWMVYINPDIGYNMPFQGISYITSYPLSIFYMSSIILLYNKNYLVYLYKPLSYVGRISLTAYIGHAVLLKFLILLLGWTNGYTLIQSLVLVCIVFTILTIFSFIWLQKFQQGPFEKIWRVLTYGKHDSIAKLK